MTYSLSDADGHSHVFLTFFMAWFLLTKPVVYISGSVNTFVRITAQLRTMAVKSGIYQAHFLIYSNLRLLPEFEQCLNPF